MCSTFGIPTTHDVTGSVSYDPANHEHMIRLRAAKVANIEAAGQEVLWTGPEKGDVLLVGWGSTFGAIKAATLELRRLGVNASACHIRYLNPLPERVGRGEPGVGHLQRLEDVLLGERVHRHPAHAQRGIGDCQDADQWQLHRHSPRRKQQIRRRPRRGL